MLDEFSCKGTELYSAINLPRSTIVRKRECRGYNKIVINPRFRKKERRSFQKKKEI